jgi:alpha-N-arabinofuranosidase
MDKYDPEKKVGLLVDEWGTWWDEEPGTISGHLYQQNTLRDAFVAAVTLNVFHKYTDRVKMTNIAQIANVLQSMILTKGDKMVLTPTFHVFRMYNVHQDATFIPLGIDCTTRDVRDNRQVPTISATASRDANGLVHISMANIDLNEDAEISIDLGSIKAKTVTGTILTSANISDYNTFENPDHVAPTTFSGAKLSKGTLKVKMPAKSIVTLELQ